MVDLAGPEEGLCAVRLRTRCVAKPPGAGAPESPDDVPVRGGVPSPCRPCLGFAIAYLISRRTHGRGLLTTLFLVPMMLSPIVVGLLFSTGAFFDAQFGVIN